MPDEYDNDLLREGVLHFKSKDYAMARRYFERALAVADDLQTQAQANFYLSQVEEDPAQKRKFLEETLAIDMGHAAARRSLAILDGRLKPAEVINPNDLPVTGTGTQTAQAERFTCPHCGGRMVYTPDGASLSCENCSSRQKIDTALPGPEQDFFVAMANGKGFQKTISTRTFQCRDAVPTSYWPHPNYQQPVPTAARHMCLLATQPGRWLFPMPSFPWLWTRSMQTPNWYNG